VLPPSTQNLGLHSRAFHSQQLTGVTRDFPRGLRSATLAGGNRRCKVSRVCRIGTSALIRLRQNRVLKSVERVTICNMMIRRPLADLDSLSLNFAKRKGKRTAVSYPAGTWPIDEDKSIPYVLKALD
jgi:hypothetical protein